MNTNMSMNRNRNSLATQTTASQKQVMTDFRLLINGQLVEGALIIARSFPQQNDDKRLNTFTKSARAKINAASLRSPMRCHSSSR